MEKEIMTKVWQYIDFSEMMNVAKLITESIDAENEIAGDAQTRQVIALGEEVGEFMGAARRYMGMARRYGFKEDMEHELADVIITAFVTAIVFDVDIEQRLKEKLEIIFTRGWKDVE